MSLRTIVKAGRITNLSDARYCAGMGVEIIGFPLGNSTSEGLEAPKIKEIAGWLAGVKIALELDTVISETELKTVIEDLHPDYLQVSASYVENIKALTNLPLLVVTDSILDNSSGEDIILYTGALHNEKLVNYCKTHHVLLSGNNIEASSVLEVLEKFNPYGIELIGGNEISPGLKGFEELSEILELLEVDE